VGVQYLGAISTPKAAQRAYIKIINAETSEERRGKLKHELLDYRKLDTLAMFRLAKFFEAV
jgi:hypothetical protein